MSFFKKIVHWFFTPSPELAPKTRKEAEARDAYLARMDVPAARREK